MAQAKVAIANEFLESYAALPRKVQKKTSEFINKFKNNPRQPGINYEKLATPDGNLYSVRMDDTYRAIVLREEGTGVYLLLWVDHHDEAYAWARRRRCAVNSRTGSLQVYSTMETTVEAQTPASEGAALSGAQETLPVPGAQMALTDAREPEVQAGPSAHEEPASAPLSFSALTSDQLMDLGVPEELVGFVRGLKTEADFHAACHDLPRDASENLEYIAHDLPYEEVLELYRSTLAPAQTGGDAPTTPAVTIAEALDNDVSKGSFHVVEGEEELMRILDAPLEKWRVFLHPSQRKLVEKTFSGPARVLGGAGTGKTVVAMHRARRLASELSNPRERVLFTTFTKNLAADIQQNLREICTTDEMKRIEVNNLDAWVAKFLKDQGYGYAIQYSGPRLQGYWQDAIARSGVDTDREAGFYADEWQQVICDQDAFAWEEYAHARRTGRGVRLNRKERADVWKVVEEYRAILRENNVRDVESAYCDARVVLQRMADAPLYRHVIVDEGQDLSRAAYRVIRALAGEEKPDDIFIVGDAHQRIYGRKFALSGCGINIRGRGNKLRVNYRTTEETKCSAEKLLAGFEYDDFDGGVDADGASTSLTHGVAPTFTVYGGLDAEVDGIARRLSELVSAGASEKDICLVARSNDRVDTYRERLMEKGFATVKLEAREADDRAVSGLRCASMHRVKGLEFEYVFIAGVDEGLVPPRAAMVQAEREGTADEVIQAERNLLYVAMTRAKRAVFVSSSGNPSSLVNW